LPEPAESWKEGIEGKSFVKICLDCIFCFFLQVLFACRAVTDDEKKIKVVLNRIGTPTPEIPSSISPAETGRWVYEIVSELTRVEGLFKKIKMGSVTSASKFCCYLKKSVLNMQTLLETALRFATDYSLRFIERGRHKQRKRK
jgi:uncharacterized protein with ATP-grasp and redox domains